MSSVSVSPQIPRASRRVASLEVARTASRRHGRPAARPPTRAGWTWATALPAAGTLAFSRQLSAASSSAGGRGFEARPLLAYMLVIHHQGRPAAYVTTEGATLGGNVAALEADHPIRRWVACLSFFAQDVLEGRLPGPYTPVRAEYFARCALMPEEEFACVGDRSDVTLAEVFNVPLEQVRE